MILKNYRQALQELCFVLIVFAGVPRKLEYNEKCSHVYGNCRHDFLEESLSRLGLQKLSIEEVQNEEWSDLEEQIERRSKAANLTLSSSSPASAAFATASSSSKMKAMQGQIMFQSCKLCPTLFYMVKQLCLQVHHHIRFLEILVAVVVQAEQILE
ncbi:hypothetical protein Droror1_Dr00021870 [Drosera rotundifolia]